VIQASYTWMLKHSALNENDGLLLGASSLGHLEANLVCCQAVSASSLNPTARAIRHSAS